MNIFLVVTGISSNIFACCRYLDHWSCIFAIPAESVIKKTGNNDTCVAIVLDLVSQVCNVVLINVYLGFRNSGGSGFWNEGYMSQGREMGS
jgi:hypothetical protein